MLQMPLKNLFMQGEVPEFPCLVFPKSLYGSGDLLSGVRTEQVGRGSEWVSFTLLGCTGFCCGGGMGVRVLGLKTLHKYAVDQPLHFVFVAVVQNKG